MERKLTFGAFHPIHGVVPDSLPPAAARIVRKARWLLGERDVEELEAALYAIYELFQTYLQEQTKKIAREIIEQRLQLTGLPPKHEWTEEVIANQLERWRQCSHRTDSWVDDYLQMTMTEALSYCVDDEPLNRLSGNDSWTASDYFSTWAIFKCSCAALTLENTSSDDYQSTSMVNQSRPSKKSSSQEEEGKLSRMYTELLDAAQSLGYAQLNRGLESVATDAARLALEKSQLTRNMGSEIDKAVSRTRSEMGRSGAKAIHSRNRENKKRLFSWFSQNRHLYRTLDAAADAAYESGDFQVEWRTIRKWITDYRKAERGNGSQNLGITVPSH